MGIEGKCCGKLMLLARYSARSGISALSCCRIIGCICLICSDHRVNLLDNDERVTTGGSVLSADQSQRPFTSLNIGV